MSAWNFENASDEPMDGSPDSGVADPPPRIDWIGADRIFAKLPELDYLVPSLHVPGGGTAPHIVGGYGFGGKSVAMQSALLATAAGRPWWGVYECNRGRARFFSGEQGERLDRLRFQRLGRGHGIDPRELDGWLSLASSPALRLNDPRAYDVLCSELEGITMAVFDSYRSFCPGLDENDSRAREPLNMLGRVSQATGCANWVIHHARKAQQGDPTTSKYMLRGSGAFFDAGEVILAIAADKGEPSYVSQVKARTHGELVEDFCIRIADVAGEGDPRWGLEVRVMGKEAMGDAREAQKAAAAADAAARLGPAVLVAVGSGAFTSVDDIATRIRKDVHATRSAVRELLATGKLTRTRRGPFKVA